MKKIRKHCFALVLILATLLSVLPLQAMAAVSDYLSFDGATLSGNNATLTVTKLDDYTTTSATSSATISNTTDKKITVNFKYSVTASGAGTTTVSHTFSSNVVANADGNASVVLNPVSESGSTFTVSVTASCADYEVGGGTVTMSEITVTEVREAKVTVNYDSSLGSVAGFATGTEITVPEAGLSLTATANSGVTFLGWTDQNGKRLSTSATYTVQGSESLTAVNACFAKTSPWFLVDGGNYLIEGMNEAATVAKSASNKTMVLANSATLPSGSYTIPSSVTLLIPYDDANTLKTTTPNVVTTKFSAAKPSAYRILTMADGAKITVAGAISVGGSQSATMSEYSNGTPVGKLGIIEMNTGSTIKIQNKANLYAWGYVAGTGTVTIESGGTVYENFQIADWRGGTCVSKMITTRKHYRVFPISQYYIQNVQVPMTLMSGATEKVVTSFEVTGMDYPETISVDFISNSSGMFRITSGSVTKDYDEANDRLMVTVDGIITMANIKLSVALIGSSKYDIDSADYVLGLNGNVTVILNSGSNVTLGQDMAMLPGAVLNIKNNATLTLDSGYDLIVYGLSEWGGYCSSSNINMSAVKYAYPKLQKTRSLTEDAQIIVGGKVVATAGKLYSTGTAARIVGTNESNGKIVMTKGSDTSTNQVKQKDSFLGQTVDKVSISIKSAPLMNGDGTSTATTSASNTTFEYYNGKWCTHSSTTTIAGKAATCTASGLTEGKNCSTCGKVITAQQTIAQKAHDYTGTYRTVEGGHERLCKNGCNAYGGFATHSYTADVTAPTCTADGYTIYTCACTHSYTGDTVPSLGHKFEGEWVITKTGHAKKCKVCGTPDAEVAHNAGTPVNENGVDSSCYAEGSYNEVVYCNECNYKISSTPKTITKKDHTPGEAKREDVVDAKCNADGSYNEVVRCAVAECNEIITSIPNTIPATNQHDYSGDWVYTADGHAKKCVKGCDQPGTYAGHTFDSACDTDCNDGCGYTREPSHTFDKQIVKDEYKATDATCTAKATYYYSCACGAKGTNTFETGEPVGHEDKDFNHICDRNCGKKDMGEHTDGDDNNHLCDYGCGQVADNGCYDVTGDNNHNCDECGKENVSDHTYSDPTCEAKATCSECGAVTGEALNHIDANTDHICDRNCGKQDMGDHADADKNHKCDYGCSATIGDCADGDKDHYCDYGAETEGGCCAEFGMDQHADTNDDNDHVCNYGCGAVLENCYGGTANCEDKAVCSVCGEKYGVVDSTNHKTVVTDAKEEPTCTTAGKTEGSHCEACNTVIVAQETISALQHNFDETQAPIFNWAEDYSTCKAVFQCTRCEETEAKDCEVKSETVAGEDCQTDGTVTYTATYGAHTDTKTKTGPKGEHSFSEELTNTDASNHWYACTVEGCEEKKDEAAHDFTGNYNYQWSTDKSSCTATRSCACGYTETETVSDIQPKVDKATCLNAGLKTWTANFAASWAETRTATEEITATGHSFDVETAHQAPTCLAAGNEAYKHCANCDLYFAADAATNSAEGKNSADVFAIDQLVHKFEGEIMDLENGKHGWKCTNPGCTVYGNETDHTFGDWQKSDDKHWKQCECGAKSGETGHDWANACDTTCDTCGQTRAVEGHKSNAAHPCQDGECIHCGADVHATEAHDWVDADCDTPKTCNTCGATEGEALGHTNGEVQTESGSEANCQFEGSYDNVIYCTICGEEVSRETVTVPKTEHDFKVVEIIWSDADGEYTCKANGKCQTYGCEATTTVFANNITTEITEATCTEGGKTVCTATFTEAWVATQTKTYPISAKDHSAAETVVENRVESTCTVAGSYESVVYCSVCKAEMSRTKVDLDLADHTEGAVVVENEVAATCTAEGSYDNVVYCSVCNTELSRETKALELADHSYEAAVTPPTCVDQGYTTYTCSACSDSYVDENSYVDATGKHTYVDGECECGAVESGDLPVITGKYSFGNNVQIGLIEPWFLQVSARVTENGKIIDYDAVDYGVYMIHINDLGIAGATEANLTYEDIIHNEKAIHLTKDSGGISIVDLRGDGKPYMVSRYDKGIYTYEMEDATIFVLYYVIDDEGISYGAVKERNMFNLLNERVDNSDYSELERDVYRKMLDMEEVISIYREGKGDTLKRLDIPTMAESGKTFTSEPANSAYSFGNNVALILIEPWGMKFQARVYTDASKKTFVNYAEAEDYGAIIYYDLDGKFNGAIPTVEELIAQSDAQVYSKLDGTCYPAGNGYIAAEYEGNIYTYQLDTNAYAVFYVKDADGYHYGDVKLRNAKDIAIDRGNDAKNFPDEKERNVYLAMVALNESITAYRDDYFKGKN